MWSEAVFQQFVEQSPATVMVRALLENTFARESLDELFAEKAQCQRPGELLFSSVVDLLGLVVCGQRRSVNEAYLRAHEKFEVSVTSVYNKLKGVETEVSRELVRRTASRLERVCRRWTKRQKPLLEGYRTRIVDGNHLASTEHRLKVLRTTRSGPLPGQALVVLDADRKLFLDVFPCEDGHAQERRILPEVMSSVQPRQLWIADRNFCVTQFVFGLARRQAAFVLRQHASTLTGELVGRRKRIGRCPSGMLYEQKLRLSDPGGETLVVRRVTLELSRPTRSGEAALHLITNLPVRKANASKVAELYLERWTIENAFQELEQALRSEIDTLGYPGAALLGFCIAVLTCNVLSVVKWAIQAEHGEAGARENLSGYYLAAAVSEDNSGMLIALPPQGWAKRFAHLAETQLAQRLSDFARHVKPEQFQKNRRGPKRPRPKSTSGARHHHVSTARLLLASRQ